jgi:protoporphyrinogen oxidase
MGNHVNSFLNCQLLTSLEPLAILSAVSKKHTTFIIGAGLSGLAAAYRLKKNYRLIEKQRDPGGLCRTEAVDGFRFDQTGHLLHLGPGPVKRATLSLFDDPPLEVDRRARIFSYGAYTHYPFQANTFGLPNAVIAECLTGFIEANVEKARDASQPKSFEAFILKHFGAGIAKHFMIPYNAKLWGVHPRDITSDWCSRFVPIPDIASVVEGALGMTPKQMGYNSRFYYPAKGIGVLPEAFARKVEPVETRTAPQAVDLNAHRIFVNGEWVTYRGLINTIPLPLFMDLIVSPLPAGIRQAAGTLKCTRLRYLNIALNRPCGTPYHWTYVPERRYPFYRVGCYSNFSEALAPPKKSGLYVELTSRRAVALSTLMPKVTSGLIDMGIIDRESDIAFVLPREIRHAYVIYNFDYSKAVPKLLDWLESRNVFSAGRYAVWEYASMQDAIRQGFAAADKIKDLN